MRSQAALFSTVELTICLEDLSRILDLAQALDTGLEAALHKLD